jgi:hypothetical protein
MTKATASPTAFRIVISIVASIAFSSRRAASRRAAGGQD